MMSRFFLTTILLFLVCTIKARPARESIPTKEEYLMLTVTTNYSGIGPGSFISIIRPGSKEPVIVRPAKNEDFKIKLLVTLNQLADENWSIKDVYHKDYQLSGSSGTSSEETVYLLVRNKEE